MCYNGGSVGETSGRHHGRQGGRAGSRGLGRCLRSSTSLPQSRFYVEVLGFQLLRARQPAGVGGGRGGMGVAVMFNSAAGHCIERDVPKASRDYQISTTA